MRIFLLLATIVLLIQLDLALSSFQSRVEQSRIEQQKELFEADDQSSNYNYTPGTDGLPELNVTGTHYAVGVTIGKTFASNIQQYVQNYDVLNKVMIPYYNTPNGMYVYVVRMYVRNIRENGGRSHAIFWIFDFALIHISVLIKNNQSPSIKS